ncbi:MAG: hypothetical protein GY810_04385 [Aureispira sp.]|nr:hypothetical protein [Aureispira sp.]
MQQANQQEVEKLKSLAIDYLKKTKNSTDEQILVSIKRMKKIVLITTKVLEKYYGADKFGTIKREQGGTKEQNTAHSMTIANSEGISNSFIDSQPEDWPIPTFVELFQPMGTSLSEETGMIKSDMFCCIIGSIKSDQDPTASEDFFTITKHRQTAAKIKEGDSGNITIFLGVKYVEQRTTPTTYSTKFPLYKQEVSRKMEFQYGFEDGNLTITYAKASKANPTDSQGITFKLTDFEESAQDNNLSFSFKLTHIEIAPGHTFFGNDFEQEWNYTVLFDLE